MFEVIILVKWQSDSDYTLAVTEPAWKKKKTLISLEELKNFIDECHLCVFIMGNPNTTTLASKQSPPEGSPGALSPSGKFKDTTIYW